MAASELSESRLPSGSISNENGLSNQLEAHPVKQTDSISNENTVDAQKVETAKSVDAINTWTDLSRYFLDSNHCKSCSDQSAISMGPNDAKLVVVLDAPFAYGPDHSRFFTARKLKLVTAILKTIGFALNEVYFTTVFKCLPDSNQSPESSSCDVYLAHELRLASAQSIMCFGEFAAQKVLKSNNSLQQLRAQSTGQELHGAKLIFAPDVSDMLDQPDLKAQLWTDIKAVFNLT
jgi:uracil-DNA glycosylase family 4